MSGGYWKLWHDTSGRFFVSFILVTLALVSTFLADKEHPRPSVCVYSATPWYVQRTQYLYGSQSERWQALNPRPNFGPVTYYNPSMVSDADNLIQYCDDGLQPDPAYAAHVQAATQRYADTMWATMTILMVFVGILLSVGPPFSGETMEAFALTFSLPWSREKWLVGKAAMAAILLSVLVLYALIVNLAASHFPHVRGLKGGIPGLPPVIYPSASHVLTALLAGLVGISLGTVVSMFARNVLTATVTAGLIAYVLVSVNLGLFPRDFSDFRHFALTSFVFICFAGLLSNVRLRRTDF